MTTISEIRTAGTELLLTPRPIYEPINAPESLQSKLGRFGDNYDISTTSHLFRFLAAICGEAGAGSIKRELLYPKLQSSLESTHFTDLDRLYGDPIALPRISEEIYLYDPKTIPMTQAEWQNVLIKDSQYRARCLLWMRAIIEGPTPRGIALAAEAASGIECDVIERYQYLENFNSDVPIVLTNIGSTAGMQEFVIVPRTNTLGEADRRRIMRLVDKLRPVNTVSSVSLLDNIRFAINITNVGASSEYFSVLHFVTGRPDVAWPPIDLNKGYWIEPGVEKEAPQYAFFNRQESATFLSIATATASSEHLGPFNVTQASLFGNLKTNDATHLFSQDYSFAKAFAPVQLTSPWLRTSDTSTTLVNTYYPLGYFADNDIAQLTADDPQNFWASLEELAPAQETLTLDLTVIRPINFLDFEICQKPIDFVMEWSIDGLTWIEFDNDENFQPINGVHYLPSVDSPWYYTEHHFTQIMGRYVRITFMRRTDTFPMDNSESFPWSIEIRNLRLAHIVVDESDFVADTGVDILGNTYRTDLASDPATNTIDGDETTFWQSKPNPTSDSVESLYYDLRINAIPGTMTYLEQANFIGGYDALGVTDLESYFQQGVVIDEIFINPVTFGPTLHVYYSNDDEPDFDFKLWTPIARNYILKKGFLALPQPVYCRFIKLEFSKLTPAPYNVLDYPNTQEVTYSKFPTWVQNHFDIVTQTTRIESGSFINPVERVSIDPLTFGFQTLPDQFNSAYNDIRETAPTESTNEIRTFISNIISTTTDSNSSVVQQLQESNIDFFGSTMWQTDLLTQLDLGRAYSRFISDSLANQDLINSEIAAPIMPEPDTQSVSNLSSIKELKERPSMFFPRTCRHQYQVLRSNRPSKISYFVAIRDVGFYRRDYNALYDEPVYFETLDDSAHILVNEFVRDDWKFVIQP